MLTEQEMEKNWRDYAITHLAIGLSLLLVAQSWGFLGLIRIVVEGAWITGLLQFFVGIFFFGMAVYDLDCAWPWIDHKISEALD